MKKIFDWIWWLLKKIGLALVSLALAYIWNIENIVHDISKLVVGKKIEKGGRNV